jgi:two-component system copper resistance phosphate regulon response regulator CusR
MQASRILIVEDEPEMANLLYQALTESGFQCQIAANGKLGLDRCESVDLMLVDGMMPQMDGFEMVTTMRNMGNQTPVIFLTAMDQTRDVIRGLESGGDDYIIKPFRLEELIARMRAILRRASESSQTVACNGFQLNTATRTVVRDGHEIHLSATEFLVFELLLRRPGKTLPKSLFLKEIWSDEGYRDENIVELYVNYLRKKTEAFGGTRVIHTVRGQGYRFGDSQNES